MKLTSKMAGMGIMAVAGLMLGTAVIADNMGNGRMDGPATMKGGPQIDIAAIDADKDGKISKDEMAGFRAARVAAVDANSDGKLSVDEIAAMQLKAMEKAASTMAQRMMDRLDSDGDKMLSAAEMMDRPMPADFFDRLDTNHDGFIDQAEADAAKAHMMERSKHRGHRFMAGNNGENDENGDDGH